MKHLKRKNAELAVIAKRLEERARKLQEANLKGGGYRDLPWLGSWAGRAPHHQDLWFSASIELERPFLSLFLKPTANMLCASQQSKNRQP